MPAARPLTKLYSNGVQITAPTRPADIRPTRATLRNLDGPDELGLVEMRTPAPSIPPGARVALDVAFDADADGTLEPEDYIRRFAGEVAEAGGGWGSGPAASVDYRCPGLKHAAARVRVRHPNTGKTEIAYNVPPGEDDYDPSQVALELGDILRLLLTYAGHATDLWYEGVTAYTADPPVVDIPTGRREYSVTGDNRAVLKAATLADLDEMTVVPNDAVRISGRSVWQQIENLVQDWMPSRGIEIEADGTIRFHDLDDPEWLELKLGDDPVVPPALGLDVSQCYTAVEVVGGDDTEGRSFDTESGKLIPDWTPAEQAAWKWEDFQKAVDASASGNVVSIGAQSVSITPTGDKKVWPVNYWSSQGAFIELEYVAGGVTFTESRRITANAASAGGTSTVTLDYPLANSGYTTFKIKGIPAGPLAHVWRRYRFADQTIAAKIVTRFAKPFAWTTANGSSSLVSTPQGVNFRRPGSTGDPFQFPLTYNIFTDTDGQRKILANVPTVKPWTSEADLNLGGASVKAPTNILVFVPVSTGLLTVRWPASGFAGEAFDRYGIKRTLYIPRPEWRYRGDRATQLEYAKEQHKVVSLPAVEGQIVYYGLWRPAVETPNLAVKLTSVFGTTPWESQKLTVRSREIAWPASPTTSHVTTLRVSNQRRPWSGDRMHTPASFLAGDPLEGRTLNMGGI